MVRLLDLLLNSNGYWRELTLEVSVASIADRRELDGSDAIRSEFADVLLNAGERESHQSPLIPDPTALGTLVDINLLGAC